jgi:hypothetical protein
MNYIKAWKNCWFGKGHHWRFDGNTLGGIWIRCNDCNQLDEFLPGLHEPSGGKKVWFYHMKDVRELLSEEWCF